MTAVAAKKIRILIADDHRVLLDGLTSLINSEKGFVVKAAVENGREVVSYLMQEEVDLCLLDISMPEMDGIETARWILEHKPETKILILTTHDEDEFISELLGAGVSGYLLKSSSKQELIGSIRRVMEGRMALSEKVSDTVIKGLKTKNGNKQNQPELTSREKEIVQLLSREFTNEKIAKELQISIRTVETHRKNIMHKTGAHNLAGLIKYAYSKGLIR